MSLVEDDKYLHRDASGGAPGGGWMGWGVGGWVIRPGGGRRRLGAPAPYNASLPSLTPNA